MRLYSDLPARRTRQVAGDVLVLVWVVAWWLVGRAVHGQVQRLGTPGRTLEDAGRSLESGLRSAGESVTRVPLVGEELRTPFDAAGGAAGGLAEAGVGVQDAVGRAAVLAGFGVALWPVVLVLGAWVLVRLRGLRRAAEVREVLATPAGEDLLALRALATLPLPALRAVDPDAAAAWRRGDRAVIAALAAVPARDAGVSPR